MSRDDRRYGAAPTSWILCFWNSTLSRIDLFERWDIYTDAGVKIKENRVHSPGSLKELYSAGRGPGSRPEEAVVMAGRTFRSPVTLIWQESRNWSGLKPFSVSLFRSASA